MKRTVLFTIVTILSCLLLCSTSQVIAQDFCEGNFDYDQDVDGTDASVFKVNFGRSTFKNPCPPDGPAPIPKTGQTIAYANGDDGARETGVAWPNPRFTDNGDGTVTDHLTGLIWLKNADCFGRRNWSDALEDCQFLTAGFCGLTDGSIVGNWRLPNYRELFSLIDAQTTGPPLPTGHPFDNVQPDYYWQSTTIADASFYAWLFSMAIFEIVYDNKEGEWYVWPVRGGH